MKPVTLVMPFFQGPRFEEMLRRFSDSGIVEEIIIADTEKTSFPVPSCYVLSTGPVTSQETLCKILDRVQNDYLLLITLPRAISMEQGSLLKIFERAQETKAGITYCDFYDETDDGNVPHPLNDYQSGSVRDDFDFGPMMLFSMKASRAVMQQYGVLPDVRYAGIYDLRLKISIDHSIDHLPEHLYSLSAAKENLDQEKIFVYVDPKHAKAQKEMEAVFTDHLRRINAYIPSDYHREISRETEDNFPVEASVIIPVKNRKNTITDAVQSALSQMTDFSFNVIVVDNHSSDGTTDLLADLAKRRKRLVHVIPSRTDLGIGGCWNEALLSPHCGQYAVQLDSDDLYDGARILQRIVDVFREGHYAMVIGSYTIVNFNLEEIPPGLIDHREWTDENGRNNALRINGLGAPRAFHTGIIRGIQFLNVSYGEDYAAALRICREYRIGRIYESLYLCRRWQGNTDASLTVEAGNRNDTFKDRIRTDEIIARQELNKKRGNNR